MIQAEAEAKKDSSSPEAETRKVPATVSAVTSDPPAAATASTEGAGEVAIAGAEDNGGVAAVVVETLREENAFLRARLAAALGDVGDASGAADAEQSGGDGNRAVAGAMDAQVQS